MFIRLIIIFVTLSFLLNTNAFSQAILEGKVINISTNAPLSFVTIRLIKENITMKADGKGIFKIQSINSKINDTLKITGVGFRALMIPVSNLTEFTEIKMSETTNLLEEVIISDRRLIKILDTDLKNSKTRCLFDYQRATKFNADSKYSRLRSIQFNRNLDYYIGNKKVKFRIRIYDVDSLTGGPGEDLCLENLEFEDSGNANVVINLEDKYIHIPNKQFFVAVEKMLIPFNERYELESRIAPNSSINTKVKIFTYDTNYEPVIYSSSNLDKFKGESWVLKNVGDMWYKIDVSTGISATLTN